MDMQANCIICLHPDDAERIIQMLVSQRVVKGTKFLDISKSIAPFLTGPKSFPISKP